MAFDRSSIDAKLVRVGKHIEAINSCVDTYAARNPGKLRADSQGKATLTLSAMPPIEIAVLAGEAIYQMKSVLDHLAFELVKLNPTNFPLPAKWHEHCEFPIRTNPLTPGQRAPMPHGSFKGLPGITKQAHTFIESVQPYRGTGAVSNSLRFLKELANIDKHRHLALTRGRAQLHENRLMSSGLKSTGSFALDHGGEIDLLLEFDGDRTVEVDFALFTFVAFNEPVLGEGPCTISVQELLQHMLDSIQGVIAPEFERFINNP